MRVLSIFLVLFFVFPSQAKTALTEKQQAQALNWLTSTDADTRRRAHQALSQLADSEQALHKAILEKAHSHHAHPFDHALEGVFTQLSLFSDTRKEWIGQCEQTLELGRENLDGDRSELRKLGQQLNAASRSSAKLLELARDSQTAVQALDATAKVLLELTMELALLSDNDEAAFQISLADIYEARPFGDRVLQLRAHVREVLARQEAFEAVTKHNEADTEWLTPAQRDFAKIINRMRVDLELRPLVLQKELCQASINHSAEMNKLGYFSHDSPTPANASPPKRAKHANYPGRWQGENIFMGSNSAQSAYDAWWNSDGHRKIMLMEGPNHLGIGLVHAHWTLSLGKGKR